MTVEIGDCKGPKDENHTAINIEGGCVRGLRLFAPGVPSAEIPDTCGECFFFERRAHLTAKVAKDAKEGHHDSC